MVAASGFDANWNVGGLMRAILVHDAFYETAGAPPYSAGDAKSLSWPVDYIVTTLRLLGVLPRGGFSAIAGDYSRSGSIPATWGRGCSSHRACSAGTGRSRG